MGRLSTGIASITSCTRFTIADLNQYGFFKSESETKGIMYFSRGGKQTASIGVHVNTLDASPYLRLYYSVILNTGEREELDYKIPLLKQPSNLGKGFRYYFICRYNGRKCTALYMAYGSHYFRDRLAYGYPIYYPCQLESNSSLGFRHHDIKRNLEGLYLKFHKQHYRGNKTRLGLRIERLEDKYAHYHSLADYQLLKRLRKMGVRI